MASGGTGSPIVIPARLKIENVKEDLERAILSASDVLKTVQGLKSGDADTYEAVHKKLAYNRAYRKGYKSAYQTEYDDAAAAQEERDKYYRQNFDFAKKDLKYTDEQAKKFAESVLEEIKKDRADEAGKKAGAEKGDEAAEKASMSPATKAALDIGKQLSGSLKDLAGSLMNFTKMCLGLIEDIYKQLKKSSPLLQAIEQLFNLAWQLFFMPIGNALALEMLPAVIEMLDTVMDIWDSFEGKSLGDMLTIAIKEGIHMMAGYFNDLGGLLKDETGIVGGIGRFLEALGNTLENDGEKLIGYVVTILEFVVNNLQNIIWTIAQMMVLSYSFLAGIYGTLIFGKIGGIAAFAAAEIVGQVLLSETGIRSLAGHATGGYEPAIDGGKAIVVSEGGQGEWIIPDDKMDQILYGDAITRSTILSSLNPSYHDKYTQMTNNGLYAVSSSAINSTYDNMSSVKGTNSSNNYYITVNGYTDSDLTDKIKNTVNDMTSRSRLRGGF